MATKEKKPDAPPAPAGAAAAAPQKKKRSKWLLIAPVLVVVLAAAGAGLWYWLRPAHGGDPAAAAKAPPPRPRPDSSKPPVFVAIDSLTVNLQPEAGEHLLQTTFSLKVVDSGIEQALKQQMPEIRSRLLLLLSSKRPSELISVAGKQQLAGQIAAEVNRVLYPEAPKPAAAGTPAAKAADPTAEKAAGEPAGTPAEKAAPKPPEAAAEPAAAAEPEAAPGPVLSVFFTSFIIQ